MVCRPLEDHSEKKLLDVLRSDDEEVSQAPLRRRSTIEHEVDENFLILG